MDGLTRLVDKVKSLFAEVMYAIVGKAAKNRNNLLETIEEGREVVGKTENSWEGVIFVLVMIASVVLQTWVLQVLKIHFLIKAVIVFSITWLQLKTVTLHFQKNQIIEME